MIVKTVLNLFVVCILVWIIFAITSIGEITVGDIWRYLND